MPTNPSPGACGTNSGYAHGCRCNECGLARNRYQRARRGTKRPRASKYTEPATPQSTIDLFKARFR